MFKVHTSNILENINSETEFFSIPGIPDKIQVTKEQITGTVKEEKMKGFSEKTQEAEMKSYGCEEGRY